MMQWAGRRLRSCLPAKAVAALLCAVLLLGGCGKDDADAERERSNAAAASTEQLLAQKPKKVPFVAVAPAPKPATVPADASCITPACHSLFATASHIHGPVSQQACNSCHGPDSGGHRYPLLREGDKLCTFCHNVGGSKMHQHEALEQGCMSCHRPHESSAKFLLTAENVERLCASCHDVPVKRYAHGPFAQGQCTVCHQPHESEHRMLLRGGSGSQHCYTCHTDLGRAMKESKVVHKPASEDCVACHDPHSSENEHELKAPILENCVSCHAPVEKRMKAAKVKHDAMTEDRQCVNCHTAHASNEKSLLSQPMDRGCLQCHDKPVRGNDGRTVASMKPALSAKFLHGPVQQGECAACHEVHGSDHAQLLTKAAPTKFYAPFDLDNYALCFSCHEKELVLTQKTTTLTNFRDGDRNLHYLHVHQDEKGRTCKTCHAPHGSDLPRHMAASVPFQGSAWPMPIRYEPAEDGGRCAPGCHEPYSYNRKQAVTRERGAK